MRELAANLWEYPADARCITTNGFVKWNGQAVMGRGCALEAKLRYPGLAEKFGKKLIQAGNHVHWTEMHDGPLITFPVKHHWHEQASLELIERSAHELMSLLEQYLEWQVVLLPRPGCGNGRLQWADVKRVLEPVLDDRVVIVTFPERGK